MTSLLGAAPSNAFDPSGVSITGLRLGMPEAEIVAAIRRQGFALTHDHGALIAKTRDGRLIVDLTEDQAALRIRYVFNGNGAGEPEKILASVLDQFGPPNQAQPIAWCGAVGHDGNCPADAASLSFLPETRTLLLQKAAAPQ
jgi:hypothetical protein